MVVTKYYLALLLACLVQFSLALPAVKPAARDVDDLTQRGPPDWKRLPDNRVDDLTKRGPPDWKRGPPDWERYRDPGTPDQ